MGEHRSRKPAFGKKNFKRDFSENKNWKEKSSRDEEGFHKKDEFHRDGEFRKEAGFKKNNDSRREGGFRGRREDGGSREGGFRGRREDGGRREGGFRGRREDGGSREGGFRGRREDGGSREGGFRGRREDGGRREGGFRGRREEGGRREGGFRGRREEGGNREGGFRGRREDGGRREGGFRGRREEGGRREGGFRGRREEGGNREGGFRGRREDGGSREGGFRGRREEGGSREGGFRGRREEGGRREGGFRGRREDGGNREGGFRGRREDGGSREGGFRGRREDGGSREGGFRGRREDGGRREGGFRGRREDGGNREGGFRGRREDGGRREGGFRGRREDGGSREGGYRNRDREEKNFKVYKNAIENFKSNFKDEPAGPKKSTEKKKIRIKPLDEFEENKNQEKEGRWKLLNELEGERNGLLAESRSTEEGDDELKPMRINRYLARCGYGARRNVEEFITSGRISVNGQVVTDFSTRINPEDEVKFDDMLVKPILKDQVLILNKPVGYLCSHMDVHHEKTVLNLLPEHFRRLNIAGRLDLNSRGLMIFSSDGDFIYKLTHPSYHVEKEYRLKISPCPEESFLVSTFLRGVEEGGDFLRAKKVVIENVEEGIVLVTLQEGKKRQLHRMFEVIGSDVLDLQRIRIGNLKLEDLDLKEGEYKEVSKEEILSY